MQERIVEIDSDSGFCFGVVNAITKAEKELEDSSAWSKAVFSR